MSVLLGSLLAALATVVIGQLAVASVEIRRRDRQIAERDDELEEWIVVKHRQLKQRWHEIGEQARSAGVAEGGAIPAGRTAAQTVVLYEYREELRDARNFVLRLAVEERWTHRLVRALTSRRFPELHTPARAERLVDFWSEGTDRNALTWSLDDILGELPARTPSRARS